MRTRDRAREQGGRAQQGSDTRCEDRERARSQQLRDLGPVGSAPVQHRLARHGKRHITNHHKGSERGRSPDVPRRPLHRHATLPMQDREVMRPDGQSSVTSSTLSRMPGRGSLCLDKSRHKSTSSQPAPKTPPVWFVIGGGPSRGDWFEPNQGSCGAAGALNRIQHARRACGSTSTDPGGDGRQEYVEILLRDRLGVSPSLARALHPQACEGRFALPGKRPAFFSSQSAQDPLSQGLS